MRQAALWALVTVLVGAGLALFSEYVLNPWASVSQLGDWVQHGVIFWGGILVGLGVAGLYRAGRRRR
ncbi:MAG: hypothetical protein ACRD0J_06365 [Acidimicrobiales bacterium]